MRVPRQRLHAGGPEFSRLAWGVWRAQRGEETSSPSKLAAFVDRCVEIGITSFDLADIYGGYEIEGLFGAALKARAAGRRGIEIVSKFGVCNVGPARPGNRVKHYDASRAHIVATVENSLKAIGTDHLDLLLVHRPDFLAPAEETAGALEALVAAGKVRAVGVSNHAPHQVSLLQSKLSLPIVTNQIELSILARAPLLDGSLAHAQETGAAPMIWSPLGGGRLFDEADAATAPVREALREVGARHGTDDIAAVAIAWLLALPSRPVPVLGSTRFERLRALAASCRIDLDRQDWYRILASAQGKLP
ncbi:MAG: aldo/keto reductase [Rhodospirillales bacterium]|nr:aldo/keto reductase [Rhodospirillales bacterium]